MLLQQRWRWAMKSEWSCWVEELWQSLGKINEGAAGEMCIAAQQFLD